MRSLILLLLALLVGCAEWPDLPRTTNSDADTWPSLQPLGDVLPPEGTMAAPSIDDIPARAEALAARGDTLRARTPAPTRVSSLNARADLLRRPVEDEAAFDALRESLRR